MVTKDRPLSGRTLTTGEAAAILGVTPGRVRQLIGDGRLPAKKVGRDLEIRESDLDLVKDRPWGRRYPTTSKVREPGRWRVPNSA